MRLLSMLLIACSVGCAESRTQPQEAETIEPSKPGVVPTTEPETAAPTSLTKLTDEVTTEQIVGPDLVAVSISGEPIYRYAAKCVVFSPDGHWLAIGYGDGLVRLWDVRESKVSREWPAHNNWTFDLQFSSDSQSLWTGGGDNRVRRWDVASGEVQERLEDHTDDVHGVAVTADGTLLVSGADDRQVVIRNLKTGDVGVLEGHTAQVTSIALDPSDTLIVSGSRDGSARIWDMATRKLVHELKLDEKHVLSVAFDHDGKRVLTAGRDKAAHIWSVETGELLHTFSRHSKRVFTAAWLNDDEVIATGSQDRHLRLIRVSDGETVVDESMPGIVADIVISPAGTLLAAALSDGNVHLYDTDGNTLTPLSVISPSEAQLKAASPPPVEETNELE